ncbi:serine/threonine-protein kinase [Roseateles amylovorans]|uniref:Serine/threonine protein kinase n=1 Tax=Roseateles amylovorans TaxID=2978473 RepID=A0ABY6AUC1_9BURK|nr:serine/threonine-protein kinase [Roseateles amylovorans]UXH76170.1 serine/threonine protein kinase [Roseateles amylovorans]
MTAVAPPDAGLPARIGKYLVRGRLGEGAMGVVYRAFDPHIQREVAVKVIRRPVEDLAGPIAADIAADASRADSPAARFRNEARAVGRIAHPGVVTIHDFGEVAPAQAATAGPRGAVGTTLGGYAYLVMELVDGRGLDQLLKRDMPTPPLTWSLGVMDQLLDALTCAHGQGVWHRDIKPGNLLITRDGRVKLTDFGIARLADRHLTQAVSQIGTPGYMAPEQYLGGPIDHRADLFACGVLLYRLASGRMPFSGAPEAVMYQTLHQDPPAPSAWRPGELPTAIDAIVRRAMARAPQDRFTDAAAMRAALAALGAPQLDHPAGMDDRTRVLTHAGGAAFASTVVMPSRAGTAGHAVRVAGTGGAATGSTGNASTGGLDATLVSQVERALATHIGPLARHLVSRDLARSGSVEDLSRSLARHIADAPEREQFIATTAALAAAANSAGASPERATSGAGTVRRTMLVDAFPAQQIQLAKSIDGSGGPCEEAEPLNDAYLRGVTEALAPRIGPIARLLVQQAASDVGDRDGFLRRLAQQLPEGYLVDTDRASSLDPGR